MLRYKWISRGIGDLINIIRPPPLEGSIERTAISEVEVLSSYNWVNHVRPTMFVPGGPPVLRDSISLPMKFWTEDTIIKMSGSPLALSMQPVFQAVEVTRPECRFDHVDLVLNRNTLEALVQFCQGSDRRKFRLKASVIHNSLILEYVRQTQKEKPGRSDFNCGDQFEKAVASYPKGLEDSTSHWRVLRYKLGPLTCVVRYEVDATAEPYSVFPAGESSDEAEAIIVAQDDRNATVVVRGHLTPHEDLVEVKSESTLSALWRDHMELWAQQMWFSSIEHVLLGNHERGEFMEVKWMDIPVLEARKRWIDRADTQYSLGRLPSLVSALKDAVRAAPNGHADLIFHGGPELNVEVYESSQQQQSLISQAMVSKFWDSST